MRLFSKPVLPGLIVILYVPSSKSSTEYFGFSFPISSPILAFLPGPIIWPAEFFGGNEQHHAFHLSRSIQYHSDDLRLLVGHTRADKY